MKKTKLFFPVFVVKNVFYHLLRDIKPFCDFSFAVFKRLPYLSYFSNIFPCKLSAAFIVFTSKIASFKCSISRVFNISSKPKMIWSNTGRVIACMAYAKTFWNRPIFHDIGRSMGGYKRTLVSQCTINRFFGTNPNPASRRFLDLTPEAFFEFICASH